MKNRHYILIAFLSPFLTVLVSCFGTIGGSSDTSGGYDFSDPDKKVSLPDMLHEVSGITVVSDNEVACVQDENGILFIYDIDAHEIRNQVRFAADGDYEGIACVGKTIYILRSDGVLFELSDYTLPRLRVDSIETNIPAANNEGLCYDHENNRLLVACKVANNKELRDLRMVYGVDLETKKRLPDPVYTIDVRDLKAFARRHSVNVPSREKKGEKAKPFFKFRPSGISIHPVTKKLYMLSAADHLLFVFDRKGRIGHIEVLNDKLFNKAEGISFLPNGDLLITNEGQERKPSLLRFSY